MVSAVDAAIAELEEQRAQIDAAIAVLRGLNGHPDGNGARQTKPKVAKSETGHRGGHPRKLEQRRAARQMYLNGITISEIAAKVGVSDVSIRNWSREEKWPEPTPK